jgi:hypothetical protein
LDSFFFALRRRAKRPAAAAPKSRTIGGAGTSVPPVLLELPPLDDDWSDELELEELLLDDELLEPGRTSAGAAAKAGRTA